ncbi:hypothetical protein [Anaerotignum neopropionicum]|uniref:hypothetical protein n=1 Tax=Anaerotignum neopropionicum TaxID=36847 RepID=UPI0008270571|nr:hypothetical protein [Anaerotignum neopropionicum]
MVEGACERYSGEKSIIAYKGVKNTAKRQRALDVDPFTAQERADGEAGFCIAKVMTPSLPKKGQTAKPAFA